MRVLTIAGSRVKCRECRKDGRHNTRSNEAEARRAIDPRALPEWPQLVACITGAFKYLENRLEDRCSTPFHCKDQHEMCGLLRAFNPAFAYGKVNELWVQRLAALPIFSHLPNVATKLEQERQDYLLACRGTSINHVDVKEFTHEVLLWWKSNHTKFPTWATAARITMCLSPNSASCERVFSLLTH
eukprot:scaffold250651_cov32-Tisochrysis_lutea.AAC.1